jgi:hypothetical protein
LTAFQRRRGYVIVVSKSLTALLPILLQLHCLRPAKKWLQKSHQIDSCMGLSEDI